MLVCECVYFAIKQKHFYVNKETAKKETNRESESVSCEGDPQIKHFYQFNGDAKGYFSCAACLKEDNNQRDRQLATSSFATLIPNVYECVFAGFVY